ncbi:MAG TPA: PEGA domain-containing protein [Sphingomicrobium sp.]|nr:PEGA domain-containing protein [Sphingomicrobium sp.]
MQAIAHGRRGAAVLFVRGKSKMRFVMLGSVAAASVLTCGCATITRGTNQNFVVESSPSQANVTLSTGQTCITPCTLRMKRKSEFVVTIAKNGYVTQEAHIHGVVKGGGGAALAGNVIFGGLIGAGVDTANGSLMNLKPNPLQVTLVPVGAAAQGSDAPAAATESGATGGR